MNTNADALSIELPAENHGSMIPWVVAAISCMVLLASFLNVAQQIPTRLEQQATSSLSAAGLAEIYPDLQIDANGRDIELSGSVRIDQSTEPVHAQLEQIEGVRRVHQGSLQVIDPEVQQQAEAQLFIDALSKVDVSSVGFQPGSIRFTQQSESALTQVLQLLKQHPASRIRIEGHTDNTGADTVNVRVSRERAAAVANYFVSRGVATDQLVVTGYGATRPIADNSTEQGRSRNRRIEVNPVVN